jgi:hypothetical protein
VAAELTDQVGLVAAAELSHTAGLVVPLSTEVVHAEVVHVVMVDVYDPLVPELVRAPIWMETAVPALTEVEVKVYWRVVPVRVALPPVGTPVTVPTVGAAPAVPAGTVISTAARVPVVAAVNV